MKKIITIRNPQPGSKDASTQILQSKINVKGAIMKQLNINPTMDKLAMDNGLGHWTCTDPINAVSWRRSDGFVTCNSYWRPLCKTDDMQSTISDILSRLHGLDSVCPISTDWLQKTTDFSKQQTLVQKPFEYPRDGALYFTETYKHQVKITGYFGSGDKIVTGLIDGISNNSFWCSETGKAVNPFGDTVISNDLIMFVWE